ncbi:MAG: Flp pilus assembly protein CpaB [Deltaproteobacteria bacterium]|nr:Flp pilus assembly protein CpaB [Deltaproteobacteria bacterium]
MPIRSKSRTTRSRRKDKGLLQLALLCVTAIVIAVLITKKSDVEVQASNNQPKIVAEYDTVTVPVPAEFVPTGTKVRDIRFRHVPYPKHQLPNGALQNIDQFVEAVTIAPLPASLPIFKENLSLEAAASNPVVERIPKGMRAMTIKVDATSAVEGWAGSGSIVDVLLVEKSKTSVIAEKVKILSAERSVSPVGGNASPNVPKTVTLLVSQEQCLAINTAIPLGRIAFALRGTRDQEQWDDTQFTSAQLKGSSKTLNPNGAVNGFVTLRDEQGKSYALRNGKWVPTDIIPEGFFVAGNQDAKDRSSAAR